MQPKDKELTSLFTKILLWMLTGLLGLNMYFLNRLVDKIDGNEIKMEAMKEIVWRLRQDVVVLQMQFQTESVRNRKGVNDE